MAEGGVTTTLVLLGRRDCPLCDEFKAALDAWAGGAPLELEVLDIDSDPDLRARYQWRIPVLMRDGVELCAGHFDPSCLDGPASA